MNASVLVAIKGTDFKFTISDEGYMAYINGIDMEDKISPAYSLVNDSVEKDQREALEKVMNPAVAMTVSAELMKAYKNEAGIVVKK